MSAESDLRRYRDEAVQTRVKIGKSSATVADKRKRAAAARIAASKTKSDSTWRSKLREAETAERDANSAEKTRADLEKKLADIEKKLATAQGRYEKDQRTSQEKALEAIRHQSADAARQFRPPVYSSEAAWGHGVQDRKLGETVNGDLRQADLSYDVFLSHASEDKDGIARPLKEALEVRGLSVWFDEIKIKVGQSIRQEIEKGIDQARFGVVVLSPEFFAKHWTQAELDALFGKKMATGVNLILPIWHRVTKDEVLAQSPLVAGILALNSSLMTVDEIADAITDVVRA